MTMSLHQLSAAVPLSCGAVLLWYALSKEPAARVLKPTLIILAISGFLCGVLVVLLDEPAFKAYVGGPAAVRLGHFKIFVGGLGTGAAMSSAFYGHWKSAWLKRREQRGLD